jgi:phage-related tail protein
LIYCRRDPDNVFVEDQKRDIEKLQQQITCKDRLIMRLEQEHDSTKDELNEARRGLDSVLNLVRSENTPNRHFEQAENLIEKIMILENFVKEIKGDNRRPKVDFDVKNRYYNKFTPMMSRNNLHG